MSGAMNEPEASQHETGSVQRFEFQMKAAPESLVIKDMNKQTAFKVNSDDSVCSIHRKLVNAQGEVIAKFDKCLLTIGAKWKVCSPGGNKLMSLRHTQWLKKSTFISVSCKKEVFLGNHLSSNVTGVVALHTNAGPSVTGVGLGALAAESGLPSSRLVSLATKDVGLTALVREGGMGDKTNALAVELGLLPAKRASLIVEGESSTTGFFSAKRWDLAAKGKDPASELVIVFMPKDKGVWEKHEKDIPQEIKYKEKGSDLLKFHFKGSWSGKTCAIYIADSNKKIAQMYPLDDKNNNTEGFFVDVFPNGNLEFVIACFATVEAMKIEAQRQKELLGHVVDFAANFLGGLVGQCCCQCCFN